MAIFIKHKPDHWLALFVNKVSHMVLWTRIFSQYSKTEIESSHRSLSSFEISYFISTEYFSVLFKNLLFSSILSGQMGFFYFFYFFIFSPSFWLAYLLLLCFHWTLKHLPFSIRSQLIERNFQSNQHLVLLFSSKNCFHYCVLYWILYMKRISHLIPIKNMIIKS